ncbi:hypothetical protein VNO77_15466 [Canavalia gladiata]|uniref:Uncharacterized protein n=1 Tax=Canavalia gladiata TaxID=3824 RepID=A0AAN9M4D5_CANGL
MHLQCQNSGLPSCNLQQSDHGGRLLLQLVSLGSVKLSVRGGQFCDSPSLQEPPSHLSFIFTTRSKPNSNMVLEFTLDPLMDSRKCPILQTSHSPWKMQFFEVLSSLPLETSNKTELARGKLEVSELAKVFNNISLVHHLHLHGLVVLMKNGGH